MKFNLPDHVFRELSCFAQKYGVAKIVLFGSRARGTHTEEVISNLLYTAEILMAFTGM